MSLIARLHALLKPMHAPHEHTGTLLQVEELTRTYGARTALESISFSLQQGDRVALIGPNGAGKTSLLRCLAGLEKPSRGSVRLYRNEPDDHICIGYVPQHGEINWAFPLVVREVVMMGRTAQLGLLRRPRKADHELVSRALEMVGMADESHRVLRELSGGQKQRVFIARALAQQAELLLLDEPFTGLDSNARREILGVLDRLDQRRVTTLVSMHDIQTAASHFQKLLLLNRELIAFGTADEVLTEENLRRAYGTHVHLVAGGSGQLAVSDTCCEEHP